MSDEQPGTNDLERVGGAEGLRPVVADFIGRVSQDFIIGFMFQGRDLERIIDKEVELACEHLGGPPRYTGRPLGQVHKRLPINSGHFKRRLAFLARTLEDHKLPPDVARRWIAANEALEAEITNGSDCAAPS